jgi:hypothetical protein
MKSFIIYRLFKCLYKTKKKTRWPTVCLVWSVLCGIMSASVVFCVHGLGRTVKQLRSGLNGYCVVEDAICLIFIFLLWGMKYAFMVFKGLF